MEMPINLEKLTTPDWQGVAEAGKERFKKKREMLLFLKLYTEQELRPFLDEFKKRIANPEEKIKNLYNFFKEGHSRFCEGEFKNDQDSLFSRLYAEYIVRFSKENTDIGFNHNFKGIRAAIFHDTEHLIMCRIDKDEEKFNSTTRHLEDLYKELIDLLDKVISLTETDKVEQKNKPA